MIFSNGAQMLRMLRLVNVQSIPIISSHLWKNCALFILITSMVVITRCKIKRSSLSLSKVRRGLTRARRVNSATAYTNAISLRWNDIPIQRPDLMLPRSAPRAPRRKKRKRREHRRNVSVTKLTPNPTFPVQKRSRPSLPPDTRPRRDRVIKTGSNVPRAVRWKSRSLLPLRSSV